MRPRYAKLLAAAALVVSPLLASAAADAPQVEAVQPPLENDLEAFYTRPAPGSVGLRPSARSDSILLPFGMTYSRESRSLVMPFGDKNDYGVGLQLNVNRYQEVELAPSGLGLQPRRTPGIIFNKRF
jgi:hypothetical protein